MEDLLVLIHLQQNYDFSFLEIRLSVFVTERQKWQWPKDWKNSKWFSSDQSPELQKSGPTRSFFLQNVRKGEDNVSDNLHHTMDISEVCIDPWNFLLPKADGASTEGLDQKISRIGVVHKLRNNGHFSKTNSMLQWKTPKWQPAVTPREGHRASWVTEAPPQTASAAIWFGKMFLPILISLVLKIVWFLPQHADFGWIYSAAQALELYIFVLRFAIKIFNGMGLKPCPLEGLATSFQPDFSSLTQALCCPVIMQFLLSLLVLL